MPVKKGPDGQRSVEAEAVVPGTPDDVWQAIATGPGITSWFVPSEVDGRVGGTAVSHFGEGNSMDSVGKITRWDPPRSYVVETQEGVPTASEWIVEAHDGGTCTVRVVHRWFADTDDWDNQFEAHTHGWAAFFRILRLYLTHFGGQPSAPVQIGAISPEPPAEAWRRLAEGLGLADASVGPFATKGSSPPLAGEIVSAGVPQYPELLLRLTEPSPGAAHMFAMPMGQTYLSVRFYFYGPQADAAAAAAKPAWHGWVTRLAGTVTT
jgi:uncharacterized protein YndB with AHSA1/START domain